MAKANLQLNEIVSVSVFIKYIKSYLKDHCINTGHAHICASIVTAHDKA